jgi:glucose/arabinose dehydrogenase
LKIAGVLMAMALAGGCASGPRVLKPEERKVIDRALIERPVGLDVTPYIPDLTAPTAIAFITGETELAGTVLLAEGGIDGSEPKLLGFRPDGTRLDIYPKHEGLLRGLISGTPIYGPVGGIAYRDGELFVSHRDASGMGVISAFKLDGSRRTVVADLPARGDFAVTDLAFHPTNKRLYFGVGAATNSGIVGIDNWQAGWVREHSDFADTPAIDLQLRGLIFDAPNPAGGLLGGDDIARTGPFQKFAAKDKLTIPRSGTGKPSASIFSISPGGGDLRVEAHGIRHPAGLVFSSFGSLFASNQGMELRGSRPVKDDPDAVVRVPGGGTWFGWPDFSADLAPVTSDRFQPPDSIIRRQTYSRLLFLIDHSPTLAPPDRDTLVRGVFPSLSGAAKMTFVNDEPGFDAFKGQLIIALAGDRAPFATSNLPLKNPVGYKLVRLDQDTKQVSDFIYNTKLLPGSKLAEPIALERPIDAKFGPDGALYIVDLGAIEYRNARPVVTPGTGRVLRVAPAEE